MGPESGPVSGVSGVQGFGCLGLQVQEPGPGKSAQVSWREPGFWFEGVGLGFRVESAGRGLMAFPTDCLCRCSKEKEASACIRWRPRGDCSLLYPCFKTALCYSVVSVCFVDSASSSSPLRPEPAPERGPAAPELAFRRPESARKIHAKSFGP